MNIDITKLKSGVEEYTPIDLIYSFTKEELQDSEIMELSNVKVVGDITYHLDMFHLQVTVSGTMILPCSVSLKPVEYPFSFEIDEDFEEDLQENLKNVQNSLDILPIIWENILMEIPMRVVSSDLSDVKTSGDGWKLITEEDESY